METLNMKDNLLAPAAETFPRRATSARLGVPFSPNPSLQGTGHLVDRTLQGVVGSLNQEG